MNLCNLCLCALLCRAQCLTLSLVSWYTLPCHWSHVTDLNRSCWPNNGCSSSTTTSSDSVSGIGGEEKLYQCPYCPKIYTTTQSLHRHKHSHTGTNMKACPLCGKTSYRVDNLKSHIRNCYKKRIRLENTPEFECEQSCPVSTN